MKRGEHELGREGGIKTEGKTQARQSCRKRSCSEVGGNLGRKGKSSRLHDRECKRLEALNTATSVSNIGHTMGYDGHRNYTILVPVPRLMA